MRADAGSMAPVAGSEGFTHARRIAWFGAASCIYWLSRAVYPALLPPLSPMPDFSGVMAELAGLPAWLREQSPPLNRPAEQVLAGLRRDYLLAVGWAWVVIAAGLASAILVARRHRVGRWLAIGFAAVLLAQVIIMDARFVFAFSAPPWRYWSMMARLAPALAIRRWVDVAYCLSALVVLTRTSTQEMFEARAGGSADSSGE